MTNIQYTTSPGVAPQSMKEDFLSHKIGSEWWYCTGYLRDESGRMFSFQFTLAKVIVYGVRLHILMTALSDLETGQHHYSQQAFLFGRNVTITPDLIGVEGRAEIKFDNGKLGLSITAQDYSLSLDMNAAKPPVWHCDNGVLRMGLDDPKWSSGSAGLSAFGCTWRESLWNKARWRGLSPTASYTGRKTDCQPHSPVACSQRDAFLRRL